MTGTTGTWLQILSGLHLMNYLRCCMHGHTKNSLKDVMPCFPPKLEGFADAIDPTVWDKTKAGPYGHLYDSDDLDPFWLNGYDSDDGMPEYMHYGDGLDLLNHFVFEVGLGLISV